MRLTPSNRVRLISEIAKRLSESDWERIDLTLGEFGFSEPILKGSYTKEQLVIRTIRQGADDEATVRLGQHLGYEIDLSSAEGEPTFWQSGYLRLFLSHVAERRRLAGEVKRHLLEFGVSTFVAHTDIEPTSEWQDEIEAALATCDGLLALLHPEFHGSNWTDQEVGYAMGRKLPILTITFGTTPYGLIGRYQAINGAGKTPESLTRALVEILRTHPDTRRMISEAAVECFSQAESFAQAKARVAHLEQLDYWDLSLSEKALAALQTNDQLERAFGVPERLERLIDGKGTVE